ncbi:beta(1,3)galactosyltransferase EpsH [Limosilactobacillus reuteri]|uniref:PssE/Cps14G family polysaccharide biosynthesis glycosyltransferase n=1 Tax=Limosilactobacillus reuteri TaxID=1598 RepID=UPI0015F83859|nr:PssE/Cps14G family polysaccharide biosynthesis glycosyltransferase [Limosilactobacillus reuteri]MBB1071734.1 beta(1,3)galactosyltransferase EpsH [Limosilactobacillus reuteri]MCC4511180.1 beta(1,3)galactosyltransferase EpsH [Limosilactobacillus reuteri]MCC4512827.1 beta(1,3)galactosyltransferase EpsH [Limosilactobacillus reuteri]
MIFVALGTQKFNFNRLLKKIDLLISRGEISEQVIAQIGYSTYKPKNYKFYTFIDSQSLKEYIEKSKVIITHAGVGTILKAKKQNKKVIVVPRLKKYKEHVDDHQLEIMLSFSKKKLIIPCYDLDKLPIIIKNIDKYSLANYISNKDHFISLMENELRES